MFFKDLINDLYNISLGFNCRHTKEARISLVLNMFSSSNCARDSRSATNQQFSFTILTVEMLEQFHMSCFDSTSLILVAILRVESPSWVLLIGRAVTH
jgi:hypothetical protein